MIPSKNPTKPWSMGRVINILIILCWVGLLGVLVVRKINSSKYSSETLDFAADPFHEENFSTPSSQENWLGIYYQGGKIGYSNQYREFQEDRSQIIFRQSFLRVQTMGMEQTIRSKSKVVLDEKNSFQSFWAELDTKSIVQNLKFKISGEVKGRELTVRVNTGGEEMKEKISITQTIYLSENIRFNLASRWHDLKEGDTFVWPFFDPLTRNQAPIEIKILGKESLEIGSEEVQALKMQENFQKLLTTVWIDREGRTLKEVSPSGFLMKSEPRKEALSFEGAKQKPIDILARSVIRAPNPKLVSGNRFLRVKISGIQLADFNLLDHRQKLSKDLLEIKMEDLEKIKPLPLPIENEQFKEFLEPTVLIQSGHEILQKKARKIIGQERNSLAAARLIYTFVDNYVIDDFSASIPSALEVLQNPHGDCNEHTVLYVALARAIGLPARTNVGLVYLDSEQLGKGFFYHAWPEVYVGEWLAIDPTLKQFPADATHLRFVQGGFEKQLPMLALIGQLKLEVQEVI